MKKALLALAALPLLAQAQPWWLNGTEAKEADFLPPDAAFQVSSSVDGNLIRVHWAIAEHYYLYRSKFDITPESPDLTLDPPFFPQGTMKTDEYLGTQEIYLRQVEAVVGYKRGDAGAHPLQIKVTYQGCAEAGLCYPPIVKILNPGFMKSPAATPVIAAPSRTGQSPWVALGIIGGSLAFFFAGLGLRRRQSSYSP